MFFFQQKKQLETFSPMNSGTPTRSECFCTSLTIRFVSNQKESKRNDFLFFYSWKQEKKSTKKKPLTFALLCRHAIRHKSLTLSKHLWEAKINFHSKI